MSFRLSTGLRNAMLGSIGFKGAFDAGKIDIYSGTIPTNADTAEGSGVKLVTITKSALAFPANGITFATPADGAISGTASETWQGVGLADGVASWFRLYGPTVILGASTTAIRLDGLIGSSSSDMVMANINIVVDATTTISSAEFILPFSL